MSIFVSTFTVSTLITSGSSMAVNVEAPSIEVKGQASVLVSPDRFSLRIAIVERGRLTDKVRAVVDNKSNQVVQVAENLGIKSHDINSARITLTGLEDKPSIIVEGLEVNQRIGQNSFPNNQHSKVYLGANAVSNQNNSKPLYFELKRTISVNFSNIEEYDQFLNKVIKLGVSHIYPLAMSVENTEKYYQQVLVQAITNAKNKASKIASHSNIVLDKLLYVKELSSNYYYRPHLDSTRKAASNHSSQVGEQLINASVLVKFSIRE